MVERTARSDAMPFTWKESWLRFTRALREHELAGLRAELPDDFVFHDHRRAGAGRVVGADAYVAWIAALFERSRDAIIEPLYYIAVESHGTLAVAHNFGTLVDGGAFESVFVQLVCFGESFSGGLFELADLELARFEALRFERVAQSR